MITLGDSSLLFYPKGDLDWMKSHASQPFAKQLTKDSIRIYFSTRNINQISSIGYIDIRMEYPFPVLNISKTPILGPGELGLFDDSGVSMGSIVEWNGKQYLYYLGWNLRVTVPWTNTIGLAIYNPVVNAFEKVSKVPIMDRSKEDPFSMSYPFVINDNSRLLMWYGSNLSWGNSKFDMNHVIRFAESEDGINWCRYPKPLLTPNGIDEIGYSRPVVLKINGHYKMWFSIKRKTISNSYIIGYAESQDGISWEKKPDLYPKIVTDHWNNDMQCYPFVFSINDSFYMLLNGNDYGKTGIGLIELK